MIVAYCRVSSGSQDYASQHDAVTAAGAEIIFAEKESARRGNERPEFEKAIAALRFGDTLIVTRLDRFARSTVDLLLTLERISNAGALFRSLGEAWCDTTTPAGVMVATIIGSVAQFERTLTLARTSDGRKRAMAAGVRFGPKPKLTPRQIEDARQRIKAGESIAGMAELFRVSRQTISRAIQP